MDLFTSLPQECISHIISFSSPRDACRSALVSRSFQSAADSDATWKRFLPSDYHLFLSDSPSLSFLSTLSLKQLFFSLSDYPILFNDGTMSFGLEKESGKKCFMMGARSLMIIWGSSPEYWTWKQLPESRFREVAELTIVWWLDVKGKIQSRLLSPKTTYAAYLVFKWSEEEIYGFRDPVELRVYFDAGNDEEGLKNTPKLVILDPSSSSSSDDDGGGVVPLQQQVVRDRGDGWKEVEMGEILNDHGDDGIVTCSLWETGGYPKEGLIIEGIELRPKFA